MRFNPEKTRQFCSRCNHVRFNQLTADSQVTQKRTDLPTVNVNNFSESVENATSLSRRVT